MAEGEEHKNLKNQAIRWLYKNGCIAFAQEFLFDDLGVADVCGIKRNGDAYWIEAKASQEDFNSRSEKAKRRRFRERQEEFSYVVDFIYYIIADGLSTEDLPDFIGIMDKSGKVIRRAKRLTNTKSEDELERFIKFAHICSLRAYKDVLFRGRSGGN